MSIALKKGYSVDERKDVISVLETMGLRAHVSEGEGKTIIGAVGVERSFDRAIRKVL